MSSHDTVTTRLESAGIEALPSRPLAPPHFIAHLTPDDKFIDIGFPLYEFVSPGTNRVVAPVGEEVPRYIHTTPLSGTTVEAFINLTHDPHCVGAVFHSLPQHWLPILGNLPPTTSVLWRGWGYEYYGTFNQTNHYHLLAPLFPHGLLLPLTRRIVSDHQAATSARHCGVITRARRAVRSQIATLIGSNRLVCLKQRVRDRIQGRLCWEHDALRRIDFFAPVITEEHAAVTRLHPWFNARSASLPYNVEQNIADAQATRNNTSQSSVATVLVGNSATLECNHVDVFSLLAKNPCFDNFRVVVPLSYGIPWYRDIVIDRGGAMFGDRFQPLVDYMSVVDYHRVLHSCTHAFMPHLRQQAGHNVKSLLSGGVKLAMHSQSLLYQHYKARGFDIATLDEVRRHPTGFAAAISAHSRERNATLIAREQPASQAVGKIVKAMCDLHEERIRKKAASII